MIKFKIPKIEGEFPWIDNRLKVILYALAGWAHQNYKADVVITELDRTQAQQDEYYADDEDYQKKPWKSVHMMVPCRGSDVRVILNAKDGARLMLEFLEQFEYASGSGEKKTAIHHSVGRGDHIHIQVGWFGKGTMILKRRRNDF